MDEDARNASNRKWIIGAAILTVVFALLMIAALVIVDSDGTGSDSGLDASARQACRHFHDAAADADILTDGELRERLSTVNDRASVSRDDDVRRHARGMLAAATRNDTGALATHFEGMARACP